MRRLGRRMINWTRLRLWRLGRLVAVRSRRCWNDLECKWFWFYICCLKNTYVNYFEYEYWFVSVYGRFFMLSIALNESEKIIMFFIRWRALRVDVHSRVNIFVLKLLGNRHTSSDSFRMKIMIMVIDNILSRMWVFN